MPPPNINFDDAKLYLAETKKHEPRVAFIREDQCIGCTKCLQACPVDTIVGASKQMHTVIEQECTGCGLCVDPCPVDCIDLITIPSLKFDETKAEARFNKQKQRLTQEKINKMTPTPMLKKPNTKQNYIRAALERVKAKKEKHHVTKSD